MTNNKSINHIAFIMDGNGRWANQNGLTRLKGHKEGAKRAFEIAVHCFNKWNVSHQTFYTFSTENWKRPKTEVFGIFKILSHFIKTDKKRFLAENIRLNTIGDITALPKEVYTLLSELKEETAHITDKTMTLALNYGAREEIINAFKKYSTSPLANLQTLNWQTLSSFLDTNNIPDPDLIIRTSGEQRLSNFLMLQAAYSELYFSNAYWPDFSTQLADDAVNWFLSRKRKFGNI